MHTRLPLWSTAKRTLDIIGSATLLVLMSPILLLAALFVKLTSPGPILFRQERIGYMATPFTMLKFRTMQVNNDPALHRQYVTDFIKFANHARASNDAAPFKIDNDPRTTAIGRLLRRTSMDELPQLWNVLRGDMSLVGPRPPIAYELEHYQPWHWRRVLEAKPGLTGLWQVTGRSRTTFDEMVRLDLRYARAKSLWLDLKILLATPRAVITGRGAR
ncbi:MAG: sugar transferase [Luteitalea sp.]|nr:sugar transferase [Luteitalea sp.]